MNSIDPVIVGIKSVSPDAFFNLIDENKNYIQKGFAGTVKKCQPKEGAKELFATWVQDENEKRCFSFFIKDQHTNSLIGLINIKNIDLDIKKCEIGYFISEKFTGKGIVSKLTKTVISFCFESLSVNKIFLRIAPENIGSQKVALKNGFKVEGVLRQEYKGFQEILEDVMYFGLLKSEYAKN